MPAKWTGKLVGKMHMHNIYQTDVAKELGMSRTYVGLILSGDREPAGGREKLEKAVDAIIARRAAQKEDECSAQ